jgi:Flp pilus assembly protein CpaB
MTYQLKNVVIAIVLGLLAAVLTIVYVTNYRKNVQHGQQQVGVLVAATDIPAGTSGAAIASGHMLKHETVPRTALVPGAISSPTQVSHLVSTDAILAGEQVSTRRFGNSTELGVRAQLKGTMRAVQLSADPDQVLAGTLRAGDHVDLVANMSLGNNANGVPQHVDRIFLRDLLVLRAPSFGDTKTGSISVNDQKVSVMLAVTDSQSTKLMFILRNSDTNTSSDGGWALELRPVTNAADGPDNVESLNTVLTDGLSAAERSRVSEGH